MKSIAKKLVGDQSMLNESPKKNQKEEPFIGPSLPVAIQRSNSSDGHLKHAEASKKF